MAVIKNTVSNIVPKNGKKPRPTKERKAFTIYEPVYKHDLPKSETSFLDSVPDASKFW